MAALPTHPSITSIASVVAESTSSRRDEQLPPTYPIHPQVDYVFLAEFDIDEGSVLRHEYPAPTGTDQHLLAEHMLPDGAHDRTEDWTVFYLNQIEPLTVKPQLLESAPEGAEAAAPRSIRTFGGGGDVNSSTGEGGGLLYVLSLVRTKKDATVRRGALVKALAVATRNPYIQIYKPILLLALEDYFSTPSVSVLARLYSAINSIDTATLPYFSLDERSILRTSDRKDLFEEKFGLIGGGTGAAGGGGTNQVRRVESNVSFLTKKSSTDDVPVGASGRYSSNNPVLDDDDSSIAEVLSPASTLPPTSSSSNFRSRSSGSISSLASLSKAPSRPPSSAAQTNTSMEDLTTSTSYGSQSRSRANTITSSEGGDSYANLQRDFMYSAAATHPLPTSASSSDAQAATTTTTGRRSLPPPGPAAGKPKDTHWYETKVGYGGINLPIRIPLGTFPSEVGDYSLINLIQTFSASNSLVSSSVFHPALHTSGSSTPPIILLFNALVTRHRVVFLGHGLAAGKVADLVLAACALASGCGTVLGGFEERCFPYTNLSNLDNLENVPGYIAGVCNPAFADRPSWWDVLCNIETGKITVSKDLRPPPVSGIHTGLKSLRLDGGDDGGPTSGNSKEKDKGDKGDTADNVFMDEILHAIQGHYGESVIRARFTEYASRFVRLASRWEEETSSITSIGFPWAPYREGRLGSGVVFGDEHQGLKELQRDSPRLEGWMATPSYPLYQQYFRNALEFAPLREFDLYYQLSRLRQGRLLSPAEVTLIYQTLAHGVKTDREIIALLAHLPSHFGGLLPLSFGLFHPSPIVRTHTLDLFDQIGSNPTGKKFLSSMNAFQRTAYNRLSLERLHDQQQQQQQQQQRHYEREEGGVGGTRDREATVTSLNQSRPQQQAPPPPPLPHKDV